jgi:hypothetical protein
MKIKTIQSISVQDWDKLVRETYGRIYSFQQQDGCKDRGVEYIMVPEPAEYCEDFENDTVPEEVNSDAMGVSFKAWLTRDPKQKLNSRDEWEREHGLDLFWKRNFYPHVSMVANDLHAKGLLPAGEYQIVIDW